MELKTKICETIWLGDGYKRRRLIDCSALSERADFIFYTTSLIFSLQDSTAHYLLQ
jgi:hypothetical protein